MPAPHSPSTQARPVQSRSLRGRPAATSHAEIEQTAFVLFAQKGFEATTLEDIADTIGIGRRTVTRYYRSKNDIPWGQFDRTLEHFRTILQAMPADVPLHEAVSRGILAFNDFPADAQPSHRERMRLILSTPALEAHSMLRYAEWRHVIAEYVAERTGAEPTDLFPQLVGQISLAQALAAYHSWLADDQSDLGALLRSTAEQAGSYFSS